MALTKREALEICGRLWRWLADNTAKHKSDWPEWATISRMSCNCPCCQYVDDRPVGEGWGDCRFCPLAGYAWGSSDDCDNRNGCMDHDSPYALWWGSGGQDRKRYALQIAEACDKALADLTAIENKQVPDTQTTKGNDNDEQKTDAVEQSV